MRRIRIGPDLRVRGGGLYAALDLTEHGMSDIENMIVEQLLDRFRAVVAEADARLDDVADIAASLDGEAGGVLFSSMAASEARLNGVRAMVAEIEVARDRGASMDEMCAIYARHRTRDARRLASSTMVRVPNARLGRPPSQ